MNLYSPISETGVTSAAVPTTKHSVKPASSSASYPQDPIYNGSPSSGTNLGPASDAYAGDLRAPVPDSASAYSAPYSAPPAAAPSQMAAAPAGSGPVMLTPP